MNKNYQILGLITFLLLFLGSCKPQKDLAKDFLYFNDADSIKKVMNQFVEYRIRKDDVLAIGISTASINQDQLLPFAAVIKNEEGESKSQAQPNYTVDFEGNIQLPLIGKVKVEDLTLKEAQAELEQKLQDYISKPSVSIVVRNFSVTVLGEVKMPGRHLMPNTNASLLDALAAAGDLTPFGNRKEILLMRRNKEGETEFSRLDLTSAQAFMADPNFQLTQNDVLYVPTNSMMIRESMTDVDKKYRDYGLIFAFITTLTFVVNLIILLGN